MSGKETTISDPENPENVKTFTFDYSYWSHDGSKELENGYFAPASPDTNYIGQVGVTLYILKGLYKVQNCYFPAAC